MGVKGLWPLLEPVGRRISIEALQNKRLAVDASIWLFQFIQAMRDERGDLIRNAHMLGFFRRICRLLFHRIRPVFVFDGATPALKKQTTAARRRRREQQHAKLRKTAEKLLMNQLKQHALGNVTEAHLWNAAQTAAGADASTAVAPAELQQEAARQLGMAAANAEMAGKEEEEEEEEEEQHQQQQEEEEVEAEDVEQAASRARKGKAPMAAEPAEAAVAGTSSAPVPRQAAAGEGPSTSATTALAAARAAAAAATAAVDELLAAQFTATDSVGYGEAATAVAMAQAAEAGALSAFASCTQQRQQQCRERQDSGGDGTYSEEDGSDGELEVLIPEDGHLDPEVLSRLPHSEAMALISLARERQRNANRQQLEARRGVPASFSKFQMQQYLEATKFRRRVEDLKDAMNSAAAGGSTARRIAGDAGREYILQKDDPQQQQQQQGAEGAAGGHAAAGAAVKQGEQHATQHASAAEEAAAAAQGGGSGGSVLDIFFDVELGEDGSDARTDEELCWEDIDVANPDSGGGFQGQQGQQHWRERTAARRRYWSLSHGFQMGRKLAAWGEAEAQETGGSRAQEEQQAEGPTVKVGGTTPGTTRKALIAGSPASRSPSRQEVPEDEDGQLQEAIRRSLAEAGADGLGCGGSSNQDASPLGAEMSLAAAADQLLQRQRGLQQRQGEEVVDVVDLVKSEEAAPPAAAQQQHPAASEPDIAASPAAAPAPRVEAVAVPGAPEAQEEGGGSGRDAKVLWEAARAAAVGAGGDTGTGEQQQEGQPELLSSINSQSAQWLEQWLEASGAEQAQQQQQAGPAAQPPASATDKDGGMEWEDAEQLSSQAAAAVASGSRDVAATGAAASSDEEPMWEDVVQPAASPASAEPGSPAGLPGGGGGAAVPAAVLGAGGSGCQQQQTPEMSADSCMLAQAAAARRAEQPAPAPAPVIPAAASKQVRFSSTMQVRLLPPQEHQEEQQGQKHEQQAAASFPAQQPEHPATATAAASSSPAGQEHAPNAAALAPAAAPAAATTLEPGGALLGSFLTAELEELAALGNEDGTWKDVVSPQEQRQQQQQRREQEQQAQIAEEPVAVEARLNALQEEERWLRASQRSGRGQAETPTTDMYQDCMELLMMFGLPYIIAPQEAEAQCAWLDAEGLVDGVVTDDNDVFLFGARRVYRHIFESKQYTEEYRAEDVQRELGVGRQELAALAQLLGSDYCEGVAGVGIVNAVEIVHAFPGPNGLQAFKEWLTAPDDELLELARGGSAGGSRKQQRRRRRQQKGGRGRGWDKSSVLQELEQARGSEAVLDGIPGEASGSQGTSLQQQPQSQQGSQRQRLDDSQSQLSPPANGKQQQEEQEEQEGEGEDGGRQAALVARFKWQHRGVRRNWEPPASFPSNAVAAAYASPKVDASKDKFTFGRPDVELLREFCSSRFGWTRQQADELLVPLERAFEQRQSQQTLDSFLTMRQRFAKIQSKRLQKVVAGIAGGEHEEIMLRQEQSRKKESMGYKRKAAGMGDKACGSGDDPTGNPGNSPSQAAREAPKRQRQAGGGGRG